LNFVLKNRPEILLRVPSLSLEWFTLIVSVRPNQLLPSLGFHPTVFHITCVATLGTLLFVLRVHPVVVQPSISYLGNLLHETSLSDEIDNANVDYLLQS
jgi:hypothetical protein